MWERRFLGDTDHPPPQCSTPSVRVVSLSQRSLQEAAVGGGSFTLVLASDGLWDVVSKEEVPALLAEAEAEATARTGGAPGGLDAEEQAAALRDEAFLRGSTDNVTVAVVCARSMSECMVGAV